MNELYLQHHGIIGQKWGVRRYQNYDGSYTQAGMKRYNDSLTKYNAAKDNTKTVKELYKSTKKNGYGVIQGQKVAVSKNVVKETKQLEKQAKKQLNKDYKHLKQDYLGDKGKTLYRSGQTITGNEQARNAMATLSGLSLTAVYASKSGQIKLGKNVTNALAGVAIVSGAASAGMYLNNERKAKQLRAYYGHTSNY